jgi:hypothetical protein
MTFSQDGLTLFKFDLLDKLLTAADQVIRPQIPSRRLRPRLQKVFDLSKARRARGGLFLSPFWAVMLHDGHRAFGPKNAKFLVYFVNEHDDPRKPTPDRLAEVRRLTKDEFIAGMDRNRELAAVNPGGGPMQHMIVVKTQTGRPGRVGASPATNFFSEGGKAFEAQVDSIVFKELDAFIRKNTPTDSQTVRFTLGFS